MADDRIRILAPRSAQRLGTDLTRRRLLGLGATGLAGLVVGPGLLAACGGDDDGGSAGGTSGGGGGGGNGSLNLFTWAEYHSPDLLDAFGNVTVTVYNSNEEAIAKLQAAGGTSGFDIIVPTRRLHPADGGGRARRRRSTRTAWPTSATSIRSTSGRSGIRATTTRSRRTGVRPAGSTTTRCSRRRSRPGRTSSTRRMGPASGQTSVLDTPGNLCRASTSGRTASTGRPTDPADLDACEAFIVDELASHLKAFDSYPASTSPRATTCCRKCGTATPARACCPSTILSATRGASAHRRPSSGWTTSRS